MRYAIEALNPSVADWILKQSVLKCRDCLGHDPKDAEKSIHFNEEWIQKLESKIKATPEDLRPDATEKLKALEGLFSDYSDKALPVAKNEESHIDQMSEKSSPQEAETQKSAQKQQEKTTSSPTQAPQSKENFSPLLVNPEMSFQENSDLKKARLKRSHLLLVRNLEKGLKSPLISIENGAPVFLKEESYHQDYKSPLTWAALKKSSTLREFLKKVPEEDRQSALNHTLKSTFKDAEKDSIMLLLDQGANLMVETAEEKAQAVEILMTKLRGTHYTKEGLKRLVTSSGDQTRKDQTP